MDEIKLRSTVMFAAKGRRYHRTGQVMAYSDDHVCVDWSETTNDQDDVIAPLPRWLEKNKVLVLSSHILWNGTPLKQEKEIVEDEV
jgi:hypothetical protein